MELERLRKLQEIQEKLDRIKDAKDILEYYLNGGDVILIENKLCFDLPEDRILIAKVENVLDERGAELEKEFNEL